MVCVAVVMKGSFLTWFFLYLSFCEGRSFQVRQWRENIMHNIFGTKDSGNNYYIFCIFLLSVSSLWGVLPYIHWWFRYNDFVLIFPERLIAWSLFLLLVGVSNDLSIGSFLFLRNVFVDVHSNFLYEKKRGDFKLFFPFSLDDILVQAASHRSDDGRWRERACSFQNPSWDPFKTKIFVNTKIFHVKYSKIVVAFNNI